MSRNIFIERAHKIHNNKYDYSKVVYKTLKINVIIICPIHGKFLQQPNSHISQKAGCRKCSKNYQYTHNEFLNMVKSYDYEYVNEYVNMNKPLTIICKHHGKFYSTAKKLIHNKIGCPKCSQRLYRTTTSFISDAHKIHNNMYIYEKTKFISSFKKIIITCKKHGDFSQRPANHLHLKQGCPRCKLSKGELEVKQILEKYNISFEEQKTFKNCFNKNLLKFDFYIRDLNTCIEYDGRQHFEESKFFGGEGEFFKIKQNDQIKDIYCRKNNIHLLRISYKDNIKRSLDALLFI